MKKAQVFNKAEDMIASLNGKTNESVALTSGPKFTFEEYKSNKTFVVRPIFAFDSGHNEKEKERFSFVNPTGVVSDGNENIRCNYSLGYRTIADYFTMCEASTANKENNFIVEVNLLMGLPQLFSFPKHFIDKWIFPSNFSMLKIQRRLLEEGFVTIFNGKFKRSFVKFNDKNLPYMMFHCINLFNSNSMGLTCLLNKELYEEIYQLTICQLEEKVNKVKINQLDDFTLVPTGEYQPVFSSKDLDENMDYSLDEFYPWIKMKLTDYFKEFIESRSNVLVLIGPPGTGKSTLIRTAIRDLNLRSLVVYKHNVMAHKDFIKTCQNFLLINTDTDDEGKLSSNQSLVVVEDADIIMGKRTDGNVLMSEILNATSGIVSDSHSKFILSTNLKDIDDIDPALLRPGRCFDILCFRELTYEEAMTVRRIRGLKEIELNPSRKYKLSEILNDVVTQHQVEPIVKPRFGFTN